MPGRRSWLLLALGMGLLLVWLLRRSGASQTAARTQLLPVSGGVVALALGIVGVAVTSSVVLPNASAGTGQPSQPQTTPAASSQADGQVRDFQLTVGRTLWELAPGKFVDAFTYNRQVPGP